MPVTSRLCSNAEASAYANAPDSIKLPVAAPAQVDSTAAPPPAFNGSGINSGGGGEPITTPAPPPPSSAPSASPDNTCHWEKTGADRLLHYPDAVVLRALLAHNLNAFCEFAFGVVRPGVRFKRNWHLDAMAEKLSQVASGRIRRLIITLPPRNLKSLYSSVALPAWFLGHDPWERVVARG